MSDIGFEVRGVKKRALNWPGSPCHAYLLAIPMIDPNAERMSKDVRHRYQRECCKEEGSVQSEEGDVKKERRKGEVKGLLNSLPGPRESSQAMMSCT